MTNTASEFIEAAISAEKEKRHTPLTRVLEALRTLPHDEAVTLLSFYTSVCDGDQGYGSWEAAKEHRERWTP